LRLVTWSTALWSLGTSVALAPVLLYFGTRRLFTLSYRDPVLLLSAIVACVRFVAPWLMRRQNSARMVAIEGSIVSSCGLALLPLIFWRQNNVDQDWAMNVHAVIFSIAIAGEAISAVAVWSWIGQACPTRRLGKYLGHREAWRTIAAIAGLGIVGLITYLWRSNYFGNGSWQPAIEKLADLAPAIWCGASLNLAAALLLLSAPVARWRQCLAPSAMAIPWRKMFTNSTLTRLLLFACWTTFFYAATIPAGNYYPRFELDLTWRAPLLLLGITLAGQAVLSAPIGSACDRFGSLAVIFPAQLLAAIGPFFAIPATREAPAWVVGMPIFQIAQVGVTLGLMRLVLKLSSAEERPMQLAVFLSSIAVAYTAGVAFGELILEALSFHHFMINGWRLDEYGYTFYIGGTTRLMGIVLLFGLKEPGRSSPFAMLRLSRWLPSKLDAVGDLARHPLD
jgi:hypothetical protein